MTTERIYIKIIFNGMQWEKMTSFNPEDEGDLESVIEQAQEAWVEFMEKVFPNFKEDWENHYDTYDVQVYEMEEL